MTQRSQDDRWQVSEEMAPHGRIGSARVVVTTVAATGRLVASLTRRILPEDDEAERA